MKCLRDQTAGGKETPRIQLKKVEYPPLIKAIKEKGIEELPPHLSKAAREKISGARNENPATDGEETVAELDRHDRINCMRQLAYIKAPLTLFMAEPREKKKEIYKIKTLNMVVKFDPPHKKVPRCDRCRAVITLNRIAIGHPGG